MPTRDEMLEFLLRTKFPDADLARLKVKATRKEDLGTLGDVDRRISMAAYDASLQGLSPDALEAMYREEHAKIDEESTGVDAARAELTARQERSRFFHQSTANADFNHWSKAAYWTLDEAVALCFGKEPTVVNYNRIYPLSQASAFAAEYVRLYDLGLRARAMLQLKANVAPADFLEWAKRNQIPYPAALEDAIRVRDGQITDHKKLLEQAESQVRELNAKLDENENKLERMVSAYEGRLASAEADLEELRSRAQKASRGTSSSGTRAQESLLKLVIGMAVQGYRYDPASSRNSVTKDIASDLELTGVGLDIDTVRKWLRESASLLPTRDCDS